MKIEITDYFLLKASLYYHKNWMVDLDVLNNNTEQILEQIKFICRSYRRFLLKFYGWPIHKTEKDMRLLHIFDHNFFSRSYFHMKIAQVVYRIVEYRYPESLK